MRQSNFTSIFHTWRANWKNSGRCWFGFARRGALLVHGGLDSDRRQANHPRPQGLQGIDQSIGLRRRPRNDDGSADQGMRPDRQICGFGGVHRAIYTPDQLQVEQFLASKRLASCFSVPCLTRANAACATRTPFRSPS